MSGIQTNCGKTRPWLSQLFHISYFRDGGNSGTKSICMASSGAVMCSLGFYRGGQVRLRSIRDSLIHCLHDMTQSLINCAISGKYYFSLQAIFVLAIPGCFPSSPSKLWRTSLANCFEVRIWY